MSRRVPHIEVPNDTDIDELFIFVKTFCNNHFSDAVWEPISDIHCSLSTLWMLQRQHVSSFTHHFKSIISEFKPFSSSVSGISIYSNPDGSRFFISLDISSPYINDLIEKVDLVGNAFQLEKFPFFPPSPHFSIFSSTSSHLKTYFEEGSSRKELITREIRRPICGGVQNESNLKEILTAYNSDSSSSETDKPLQKRVKLDSTKRENNENKMENLQSWVQQFIALTDGMEDLWIDQVCLKVGADLHFVNLS